MDILYNWILPALTGIVIGLTVIVLIIIYLYKKESKV